MITGKVTTTRVNDPKVSLTKLRGSVGREVVMGIIGEGTIRGILQEVRGKNLIMVRDCRRLSGSVAMEERAPDRKFTQGEILFMVLG